MGKAQESRGESILLREDFVVVVVDHFVKSLLNSLQYYFCCMFRSFDHKAGGNLSSLTRV